MSVNLFLFAVFVVCMLLMSYNYTKGKRKIIFFGDSITEFGTQRGGYINLLRNLLKQYGFEEKYELIGAGIGGDKVFDLYIRADRDVLLSDPYLVIIFIGINDVWHKLSGKGTDETSFKEFYIKVVHKVIEGKAKLVLCTPPAIGEKVDFANEQDVDLDKYAEIIRTLAHEYDVPVVDLRKVFLDYNATNNIYNNTAGILTKDGVHLNDKGNQVVAEEMWKVLQTLM